eukprot:SAG25_NODE_122_length_14632_cov_129.472098_12_plen_84_part_00
MFSSRRPLSLLLSPFLLSVMTLAVGLSEPRLQRRGVRLLRLQHWTTTRRGDGVSQRWADYVPRGTAILKCTAVAREDHSHNYT